MADAQSSASAVRAAAASANGMGFGNTIGSSVRGAGTPAIAKESLGSAP